MKKFSVLFFLLIFIVSVSSLDNTGDCNNKSKFNFIIPDYVVDITIEGGIGVYIGDFRGHLLKEGAYAETPVFDIYISIFLIKYFGVQVMLSSGCVIHPRSQPIEGTIMYMAVELFSQYDWKYGFIKIFAGVGYEHATMLIWQYGSGFFEAGFSGGVRVSDWIYLQNSIKYRMGFLHSLLVHPEILMSITISFGVIVRIKNIYKKR